MGDGGVGDGDEGFGVSDAAGLAAVAASFGGAVEGGSQAMGDAPGPGGSFGEGTPPGPAGPAGPTGGPGGPADVPFSAGKAKEKKFPFKIEKTEKKVAEKKDAVKRKARRRSLLGEEDTTIYRRSILGS